MKGYCVVLRILVCVAVFYAAGSLSCRPKTAPKPAEPDKETGEVNKPQPAPPKVDVNAAKPSIPVETDPNSVAVTVNGINITEGEVDKLIEMQLAGSPKQSPEIVRQYKKMLRPEALNALIVGHLLDEKVKEANIVVTDEEATDQLKKIAAAQKPAVSLDDFKKKLEEYGQNFDEVKGQIRKGLSYQKLIEAQPGGKITVTEQDANSFYTENKKLFETPEQVRASHILIRPDPNAADPNQAKAKAMEKIKGLLEQVKAGADFAKLATENSACPSAARGGDLDFFGRGYMEPSFEKTAFATDVNQISDIVESSYGYHIIKVTDRKPASVIPFEEVKDQIINQLTQRKRAAVAGPFIESLRVGAKIVYPPGKEPKSDRPVAPVPAPPEQ